MTHHVDLLPGQQLFSHPQPGQENVLFSVTKAFMLKMQEDGNLVYLALNDGLLNAKWSNIGDPSIYNEVVWSSGTSGQDIDYLIMQDDGNLVLYNYAGNGKSVSNSIGHPGAFLRPQDDGNLVVYAGGNPIWASSTNART